MKNTAMHSYWRKAFLIIPVAGLLLFSACQGEDKGQVESSELAAVETAREVVITREQFEHVGMRLGDPFAFEFMLTTTARGYIKASPSGHVRISPLVPGQVKEIRVTSGDYVRKGQVLFTMEGREIIQLQQEYASAFHELKAARSNYERQKALSEEDITSRKSFLQAESDYRSLISKAEGLKAQLHLIRMDPQRIEEGNIYLEVPVVAPIQGFITGMDLVLGQYVEPHEVLIDIVDTDQFRLHLNLFDKDLEGLEKGQTVRFYRPDHPERVYEAVVTHLGKSIDPHTKTLECLASLQSEDRVKFVHNLYVEASIITCRREAMAIPDQALIVEEGKSYVLILKEEREAELVFEKTLIQTGVIQQGHAEFLDEDIRDILLEGVYNLNLPEGD